MLTLLPLAQRLGLAVQDDLDSNAPEDAAAALASIDGTVVVAWRQDTLPALAAALAARLRVTDAAAIPCVWPEDRFDPVWVFEPDAAGAWRFRQHLPRLLGGDTDAPIA